MSELEAQRTEFNDGIAQLMTDLGETMNTADNAYHANPDSAFRADPKNKQAYHLGLAHVQVGLLVFNRLGFISRQLDAILAAASTSDEGGSAGT